MAPITTSHVICSKGLFSRMYKYNVRYNILIIFVLVTFVLVMFILVMIKILCNVWLDVLKRICII